MREFLHRFTTVAGYVVELPSVIHLRDATDTTKAVAPYEDSELANIMKHAFSLKWQTQYDLGHKAPPTVEYLQNAMEKIEVAFPLQNANGSPKNSGKPGKMSSLNDKIPKKKSTHASGEVLRSMQEVWGRVSDAQHERRQAYTIHESNTFFFYKFC